MKETPQDWGSDRIAVELAAITREKRQKFEQDPATQVVPGATEMLAVLKQMEAENEWLVRVGPS